MRFQPISALFPSQMHRWSQWVVQDIVVNSLGSQPVNQTYRDVTRPIHVEPAAKIYLSPEALALVTQEWQ